ncbi:MAG: hypothetical protein ACE5KM_21470, partial [Planctomycetaceae bacterium]
CQGGGHPRGDARGSLTTRIDVTIPTVYSTYQKCVLGAQPHVQLTFTLSYPRHARTKPIDIEQGHIDSNVVRITLDSRNRPLIYTTGLACGYDHKVFGRAAAGVGESRVLRVERRRQEVQRR